MVRVWERWRMQASTYTATHHILLESTPPTYEKWTHHVVELDAIQLGISFRLYTRRSSGRSWLYVRPSGNLAFDLTFLVLTSPSSFYWKILLSLSYSISRFMLSCFIFNQELKMMTIEILTNWDFRAKDVRLM